MGEELELRFSGKTSGLPTAIYRHFFLRVGAFRNIAVDAALR
jgi:hypothetical protein